MGMETSSCIHVGVSFIDEFEKDKGADSIGKMEIVADELNLDSEIQMHRCDHPTDMFIGKSFYNRPTDKQVAKAKKKVKKLLPKIEELMGCKASSKVEVWNVVTVTY